MDAKVLFLTFLIMPLVFLWLLLRELHYNPRKKKKGQYQVSWLQHARVVCKPVIFGYGSNRYIDIAVLIFGLLLLPLTLIGFFSHMLVAPPLFAALQLIALMLCCLVAGYALWLCYRHDKAPPDTVLYRGQSTTMSYYRLGFSLALCSAMFIFQQLVYGAPYVLHHLFSDYASVDLIIADKPSRYEQKSCSGELVFQHYRLFNRTLCGFEPELWHSVQPGDKIRIYGRASALGVSDHDMAVKLTAAPSAAL